MTSGASRKQSYVCQVLYGSVNALQTNLFFTFRSHVVELQQFLRSKNLPTPRYECQMTNGTKHQCTVHLPNGMSFVGSVAKTPNAAIESAAGAAIMNLVCNVRQVSLCNAML